MFDGGNYQIWAVRMETYLDAVGRWEAVEQDYEIPPLPDNPTMAHIKSHKDRKARKLEERLVCLLLFHQLSSLELCHSNQQRQFGIISILSMKEMRESKECKC